MGMFDWYEPTPDLRCPVCEARLDEWQGNDAACVLFVWRQGEAAPIDWLIDKQVQVPATRAEARLPSTFRFSTSDAAGHKVEAEGRAPDGIWTTTRLTAVLKPAQRSIDEMT